MKTLKTKDWFPDPSFPFIFSRTGAGNRFPEHRHDFFELFLVTRGALDHSLNGIRQVLRKGDLVLLSPSRRHGFAPVKGEHPSTLQAIFMPSLLGVEKGRLRKGTDFTDLIFMLPFYEDGSTIVRLTGKSLLKVTSLLEEMETECRNRPRGYRTAVRAKLTDLLITAARTVEKAKAVTPAGKKKMTGTARAVLDAVAYIDARFTDDLQVEEVAARTAGVSREYFSTLFRNLTGTTFTDYVTGRRIDHACTLLTSSDEKIIMVCHASGFNDLSHFNKTFKKVTGETPSGYRIKRQKSRSQPM